MSTDPTRIRRNQILFIPIRVQSVAEMRLGLIETNRHQIEFDRVQSIGLKRESRPVGALRLLSVTQPRADAPWAIESRPGWG